MVKLTLLCLLAIICGVGTGISLGRNNFSAPDRFGPFGEGTGVTPEKLSEVIQAAKPESGLPRAEVVNGKAYDFGTAKRGAKGEHVFTLRNAGDGPLELKVLTSTCKCTVGNLEKEELAPGEQTEVKLSWEIKTSNTSFSQSATVRTSDPDNLEVVFSINGNVVDDVTFDPASWNVAEIEPQSERELLTTVYLYQSTPFHVIEAGWTREQIAEFSEHTLSERPIDPELEAQHRRADRAIDLRIKLKPGLRQGPLSETFRIRYWVGEGEPPIPEKCSVFDIPLNGSIVGSVSIFGSQKLEINNKMFLYALGTAVQGETLSGNAFISVRGATTKDTKLKIGQIYPEDAIVAELGEQTEQGNRVLVPLKFGIRESARPIELSGRDRNDYGWIEVQFEDNSRAPVKLFLNFIVKERE